MKALINRWLRLWAEGIWLKRIDREIKKSNKLYVKYKAQKAVIDYVWKEYNEKFYGERSENGKS